MLFNAKNELDRKRAIERFKYLLEKEKTFELTEKRQQRTLNQNNYLHLILSYYALEYGETTEYIKQDVFKKQINRYIFLTEYVNRKTGEFRESWRSTRDLNTKEMTDAIERFRNYASKEFGIYLPTPEDRIILMEIEREIENNKQWL